jgi:hypothetical protein
MFELDRKGAFVHRSPTYDLLRRIPKVAGSPYYGTPLMNTARTTPFETVVEAETPEPPLADEGSRLRTHAPLALAEGDPRVVEPDALALRVTNTAGQGARLRAAPSRDAALISILEDGTLVQALGPALEQDEESWLRVRAEDGSEGWIAAALVAPAYALEG